MNATGCLALCALLLAGCAPDDVDQAGNVYPPECSVAATAAEPATVTPIDPVLLDALGGHPLKGRVLGAFLPPSTIFIDETMVGWQRDDAVRHEKCHAIKYRLTGNAQWHG